MPRRRVRVGVSACLLGEKVRWDGGDKRDAGVVGLGRDVEWVPVCPEVEAGLGVPRAPIRLEGDPERPRVVAPGTGRDLTGTLSGFARRRITGLARLGLSGYVFKSGSPSCGLTGVPVHGTSRRGRGVFARALTTRFPLLPVADEDELHDPARRENFVERVLAYTRWRRALAVGMTRARLARFHAANELVVLAHAPAAYRRLGELVGSRRPPAAVVARYGEGFMRALAVPATPARHATVLARVLRRLSPHVDGDTRGRLARAIARYRAGLAPLGEPVGLLRRHAARVGLVDLARQSYLDPRDAAPLRVM